MSRAKQIRYIVIHCQAGHGTLQSMQAYWKNTLGWKSPGYSSRSPGEIAGLRTYQKWCDFLCGSTAISGGFRGVAGLIFRRNQL